MKKEDAEGIKSEAIHTEPILYVSCGVPGSGKSTFLKKHIGSDEFIISRDEIRFGLLKENEEYFSHENEVFDKFIDEIIYLIKQGKNVYADATHLNARSRDKLIWSINAREPELLSHIEAIFFDVPIDICLERNEYRKGTKAYVPRGVIRRMYSQLEIPNPMNEPLKHCWIINKDGEVSKYF